MGQEISGSEFDAAAFAEFRRRLDDETRLLAEWLAQGRLNSVERRIGFEIEAWLIDGEARPAARNQEFLAAVDDPYVVPELARFNFEINSDPLPVAPGAFDAMHDALLARWQNCQDSAAGIGRATSEVQGFMVDKAILLILVKYMLLFLIAYRLVADF